MAKSVDGPGRGARLARRDEGDILALYVDILALYVTEEQRSQPGCIWKRRQYRRLFCQLVDRATGLTRAAARARVASRLSTAMSERDCAGRRSSPVGAWAAGSRATQTFPARAQTMDCIAFAPTLA